MNERLKELLGQAYDEAVPETWTTLSSEQLGRIYEKFAELIVRECAQYMYEHYPHSLYEINYMRKHMGDADWNKPIRSSMMDGYNCVICGRFLPANEYGVIVHDDIPHPPDMDFAEEENT